MSNNPETITLQSTESPKIPKGSDSYSMNIHKGLMIHYSPYYNAAFKGPFIEATAESIPISATRTALENLSSWLYTGDIIPDRAMKRKWEDDAAATDNPSKRNKRHELMELYILADAYDFLAIRRWCFAELHKLTFVTKIPLSTPRDSVATASTYFAALGIRAPLKTRMGHVRHPQRPTPPEFKPLDEDTINLAFDNLPANDLLLEWLVTIYAGHHVSVEQSVEKLEPWEYLAEYKAEQHSAEKRSWDSLHGDFLERVLQAKGWALGTGRVGGDCRCCGKGVCAFHVHECESERMAGESFFFSPDFVVVLLAFRLWKWRFVRLGRC